MPQMQRENEPFRHALSGFYGSGLRAAGRASFPQNGRAQSAGHAPREAAPRAQQPRDHRQSDHLDRGHERGDQSAGGGQSEAEGDGGVDA